MPTVPPTDSQRNEPVIESPVSMPVSPGMSPAWILWVDDPGGFFFQVKFSAETGLDGFYVLL